MSSIAYQIAHKRVLVVEQVLEEWQIEREKAMLARDIDELVEEAIDVLAPIKRLVAEFDDSNNRFTNEGKIVAAHRVGYLLNKAIALFQKIDNVATNFRCADAAANRLNKARAEFTAIRDAFSTQWMLPDQKTVRTAKEQAAAGKYREL